MDGFSLRSSDRENKSTDCHRSGNMLIGTSGRLSLDVTCFIFVEQLSGSHYCEEAKREERRNQLGREKWNESVPVSTRDCILALAKTTLARTATIRRVVVSFLACEDFVPNPRFLNALLAGLHLKSRIRTCTDALCTAQAKLSQLSFPRHHYLLDS